MHGCMEKRLNEVWELGTSGARTGGGGVLLGVTLIGGLLDLKRLPRCEEFTLLKYIGCAQANLSVAGGNLTVTLVGPWNRHCVAGSW